MAKARKTISIEALKAKANELLAAPANEVLNKDYKAGVANLITWSLMQAGAYEGFRFLDNDDSEWDTLGFWQREYY